MDRLPPAALVLASALALAACRDSGDGLTTIVTGVTTNVTSLSTDTTAGSTSSSTSGGSDAGSSTTSTATTEPGTSTTTTTSSSTSTTTTPTTGDDTTTTGDASSTTMLDPVAACLAEVDPGDECNACICTDCLMLWDACHADMGCTAIQQCAQTNGCYGQDCDAPCAATMNLYGPPDSPSRTAWKALSACLLASCSWKCPW